MTMHPEYPEVVKAALVSDLYWRNVVIDQPRTLEDLSAMVQKIKDTRRIRNDVNMAARIGSILTTGQGGTIHEIAAGEPLPIPHARQVVKVIEDRRTIAKKTSPLYQIERLHSKYMTARTIRGIRRHFDPEFTYPTFEEDLEALHACDVPFGPAASLETPYGRARIAQGQRGVFYLKYDEKSGMFAAMPSTFASVPEAWGKRLLETIPQAIVGEAYPRSLDGSELGRVVSAALLEVTSVDWQNVGGNDNQQKESVSPKKVLSGLAHTGA